MTKALFIGVRAQPSLIAPAGQPHIAKLSDAARCRSMPVGSMLLIKAQIKGANTGDLFATPVHVKGYVREGHTVAAHTEMRHVRHEAPSPTGPKSYPWESASQNHMIYRMGDDELVAAMTEAVSTPRSLPYLDAMRISTKGRRDLLPPEKNAVISAAMARAEGLAGRSSPPAKPVVMTTEKPASVEPDHIAAGRATLARYKERLAARAARGLPGLGGGANDEKSMALWEARLSADPAKWKPGMGASYQVASGGKGMQTNRGFRIVSIDVPGKRAVLRQVADTGMTSSGGDSDRFDDMYVYLGELKRDKKYDKPVPVVARSAA